MINCKFHSLTVKHQIGSASYSHGSWTDLLSACWVSLSQTQTLELPSTAICVSVHVCVNVRPSEVLCMDLMLKCSNTYVQYVNRFHTKITLHRHIWYIVLCVECLSPRVQLCLQFTCFRSVFWPLTKQWHNDLILQENNKNTEIFAPIKLYVGDHFDWLAKCV